MLKVDNVTKYYGDFRAVHNLSFSVKEGEIFGLLGVNGAGKTTTFRMILGLLSRDSGTITLDGKNIDYSVTDKIGFLTEERSLLVKMTVKEQILYYATLKGMDEKTILKRLKYWLNRFGISSYENKKIKELSKGNQQKVQFITAIIHNPKLLILDEPFSGLDPINVAEIMEVIRELKNKKTIIIFSSHRMEHVEMFCEKLVVLVNGESVLKGSLEEIKKEYEKKNIFIKASVKENELKQIPGVLEVEKTNDEYKVKIDKFNSKNNVFEYLKTCSDVTKFSVEDASLNEIFLDKVGGKYEK